MRKFLNLAGIALGLTLGTPQLGYAQEPEKGVLVVDKGTIEQEDAELAAIYGESYADQESTEEVDPFEPMNRVWFKVNVFLDENFLEPLTTIYEVFAPEVLRRAIGEVFQNLNLIYSGINWVFQAEREKAIESLGAGLINGVFGFGGIMPILPKGDDEALKTDFGYTLASWGIKTGVYLVLPVLGATTPRDIWNFPMRWACDPVSWWVKYKHKPKTKWVFYGLYEGLSWVDWRAGNRAMFDRIKEQSIDLYALARSFYLQQRQHVKRAQQSSFTSPNQKTP